MVRASVFVLLLLAITGKAENIPAQKTSAGCPPPFYNVGGRCVHLVTSTTGSWHAMRILCLEWGSDLLKLDSADYLYDLVNYIKYMGLAGGSYWIGGDDEASEGFWTYPDGSVMKIGTPFWANSYDINIQQPQGGTEQNCAMLSSTFHYYIDDFSCSAELAAVCEIDPVSMEKDYRSLSSSPTAKVNNLTDCPSPFYDVGGRCLLIDNVAYGSWYEMRIYCIELGSDLLKLDSGDFMYDLVNYIHNNDLSSAHYWIGGTDENNEGHWIYPDGAIMKMSTPFWANTFDEQIQMPGGGTKQNCSVLDAGFHYYINDFDCNANEHVICEKNPM